MQPFEGFAPIDLGGEFIHGSSTIINRIAKENNWLVQPVRITDRNNSSKVYSVDISKIIDFHSEVDCYSLTFKDFLTLKKKFTRINVSKYSFFHKS